MGATGEIARLEAVLGHQFAERELLVRALAHRSWANENPADVPDNQRLEFLGDAILGMVISECLFTRFPQFQEGALSRLKAHLVCEASLAEIAEELGVGEYVRLGRGEEISGGREKLSVLADCYEAIVAAVFLDAGYEACRHFVLSHHEEMLEDVEAPRAHIDSKSRLQELLQHRHNRRPGYRITAVDGPDHNRTFTAEVRLDNEVLGKGEGRSKKEAQQAAAFDALSKIDDGPP